MKTIKQHRPGTCVVPILQHGGASILPLECLGAAIIISQIFENRGGLEPTLTRAEAVSMLRIRGASEKSSAQIIDRLCAVDLFQQDSTGVLCVPVITESLNQSKERFANRQAGWGRRKEASSAHASTPFSLASYSDVRPIVLPLKPTASKTQASDSSAVSLDSSDVLVEIICKDGKLFEVTSNAVKEWSGVYKSINVLGELKKAALWSQANPTKRKMKRGMSRFIMSWMSHASQREDTMRAVVASKDRGRGFGRGGEYESPALLEGKDAPLQLDIHTEEDDDELDLDKPRFRRSVSPTSR